MIILILGGVGQGKTLSAIKEIIDSNQYVLTNFKLLNMKNYHRIKVSDIINKAEKTKDYSVNWKFWDSIRKEHKSYSIVLDEISNIIHSRRATSKINVLMSKWVSQIRKILSDHPDNHLYLISQTLRKIDVDFRELAQMVISCQKKEVGKKVYIRQKYYDGIGDYEFNFQRAVKIFLANQYFKYYKTTELVTFSDAEEFV